MPKEPQDAVRRHGISPADKAAQKEDKVTERSERAAAKAAAKAERSPSSGSDEERLIWLRQEPAARRPVYTRADIAQIAVALADTNGLEGVSMRNVAQQLGIATMTLYSYVHNKDELITLMVNAVMAEILVPAATLADDWRTALTQIATRVCTTFAAHRWTLDCLRLSAPGPNALRHFEQSLRAVAPLGLEHDQALEVINQIDDYVYGFALREAQELHQHRRSWPPQVIEFFQRELATGDYPFTQGMFAQPSEHDSEDPDSKKAAEGRFQRGLEHLLDGLAGEFAHA